MSDHAASIQGVALRVCRLSASGAPLTGTSNAWVTDKFISLQFTPEYTDGDEIEQKGADGSVCVYYQAPNVLKRVTLQVAICGPEPEIYQILNGGSLLTPALETDPTGYAGPVPGTIATPNGIGIEVWSRAIVAGHPASTNPYWYFVFPYCQLQASGDRTLENGLLANTFEGYGVGNTSFGDGPAGSWPFTTASAYQWARAATIPTVTNDYVSVT